nr:hypothetical protein [Psychromicrobium sp. YIM S02556]
MTDAKTLDAGDVGPACGEPPEGGGAERATSDDEDVFANDGGRGRHAAVSLRALSLSASVMLVRNLPGAPATYLALGTVASRTTHQEQAAQDGAARNVWLPWVDA